MTLVPILIIAGIFWPVVIKWNRALATRDFMASTRPTAADVAAIEATLPKMKGQNS